MRKEVIPDKTRAIPVHPNLPKWVCQNCQQSLTIVGVDSYAGKFFNDSPHSAMQGSSIHGGANSVLGSTRMDNSFVVLPRQKPPHQAQGIPPRPRASSAPDSVNQSGKAMEESFVVVYKSESASDSKEVGQNGPLHSNTSGFNATINFLTRAFDLARTQTHVEQPLCLECMRVVSDKLEKEVEDVTRDVEAYEACVQRLEGETQDVLSEADFLKEKKKIEEEERKLVAAIEETEKQNAEVNSQLKELELKGNRFNELEDRYWQEFNNFQFQLIAHQVLRSVPYNATTDKPRHFCQVCQCPAYNEYYMGIHEESREHTLNVLAQEENCKHSKRTRQEEDLSNEAFKKRIENVA